MKKWKSLIAGLLILCLIPLLPCSVIFAEEIEEGQEAEDPFPKSYYYPIESNEIAGWPQGPQIESAAAVVMELSTGTFLYSKNATEKMYPASTTKIMTTLLLVENCNLDDEITFSEIVYDLEEGSSHLGIQPGEKMTLRDAAYGIMLASANDISNGVAEYIGGSLSGFADMMNAKAAELGCVNTHFANPHGLYSDDHYTCARDMALIAQAAYANPLFREIATTREHTIPKTNLTEEERSFLNHHKMMQKGESYYKKWCTAGKTGYTSQCLNTLVTYGEKGGKSLVSVVFRVNGADKAYTESTQILEYGFKNFVTENIKTGNSNKTFYDIMGLNYLGDAQKLQSDVWKRSPEENGSICVTLPKDMSLDGLTYEITKNAQNETLVNYKYHDVSVGSASGKFGTVYVPAQLVCEGDVEVYTDAAETSSDNIQIESFDEVLTQTTQMFRMGYEMAVGYAEAHPMVILAGGALLLILLIVFIIILIFRCTAESRIRRRRMQEEKERQRRAEEIDRMTAAEIEAELRAVMEQERKRREQEELTRIEAEKAAEYERLMEEKAHETERLIDELEQERNERMASRG